MSQTLIGLGLFVLAIACLPWAVRWMQGRSGMLGPEAGKAKVLSVMAVGPQQRVVTVQVAAGSNEAVLVLGVTASAVNCLHKWESSGDVSIVGVKDIAQHGGQ